MARSLRMRSRAEATHLGLEVTVGREPTDALGGDYRGLADEVLQSGADVVYWGGFMDDKGGGLWQALRNTLGTRVLLMGGDGIDTPIFLNAAGSAAEGTYATFPSVPASNLTGKGADWYLRYKQQYRSEPDPYAAYAYEAINVAICCNRARGQSRSGCDPRRRLRDQELRRHPE